MLNVNANQIEGTKDVQIDFEITNKIDYSGELNVEVWTGPVQTQINGKEHGERVCTLSLPTNDEVYYWC